MKNLIGQKFNALTAIGENTYPKQLWLCECGVEKYILRKNVVGGHTKACGCKSKGKGTRPFSKKKHGYCGTPTYNTWASMHNRCRFPVDLCYKSVSVCEDWDSFETFLADMGERPKGMTLDRINPTEGYYKENCRWATIHEQARNKLKGLFVLLKGESIHLKEACAKYNISYNSVRHHRRHKRISTTASFHLVRLLKTKEFITGICNV